MASSMSVEQQLSSQPGFASALKRVVERSLVDLDPWALLTSDEQIGARSEAVNRRYPGRVVLCFAERQDTDDVACAVLSSSTDYAAGKILIVHDFANPGSEVDAVFSDFWEWFRAAIDDMIDMLRHWDDLR